MYQVDPKLMRKGYEEYLKDRLNLIEKLAQERPGMELDFEIRGWSAVRGRAEEIGANVRPYDVVYGELIRSIQSQILVGGRQ